MENFIAPDDDVIRPIVLVRIRNVDTDASELVFAMLDTCADKDVISENVVKRLNLPNVTKTMTVQTVDTKMTQKRRLANLQLESIHSPYKIEIEQYAPILGWDFFRRYRLDLIWGDYGDLFLRDKKAKIAKRIENVAYPQNAIPRFNYIAMRTSAATKFEIYGAKTSIPLPMRHPHLKSTRRNM